MGCKNNDNKTETKPRNLQKFRALPLATLIKQTPAPATAQGENIAPCTGMPWDSWDLGTPRALALGCLGSSSCSQDTQCVQSLCGYTQLCWALHPTSGCLSLPSFTPFPAAVPLQRHLTKTAGLEEVKSSSALWVPPLCPLLTRGMAACGNNSHFLHLRDQG